MQKIFVNFYEKHFLLILNAVHFSLAVSGASETHRNNRAGTNTAEGRHAA